MADKVALAEQQVVSCRVPTAEIGHNMATDAPMSMVKRARAFAQSRTHRAWPTEEIGHCCTINRFLQKNQPTQSGTWRWQTQQKWPPLHKRC